MRRRMPTTAAPRGGARAALATARATAGAVALSLVSAVAGAATAAPVAEPSQPAVAAGTDPVTALTIGREAYDYGLPLLEFLRVRSEQTSVRCPDGRGNAPVNSFSHTPTFAGPQDRTVVAPNTDTLYSIAHLDLARGPITLRHPAMGRRYVSFAMLDPFTNVIATPGVREDGPGPATIRVRWTTRPGRVTGRNVPPPTRVVNSPSRFVWIIGRTLATDTADQRAAYRQMQRYTLTLPDGRQRRFAAGCRAGAPRRNPTPTDGATFIARLNRALADNPPPRRDAPLLARLKPYGIGAGLSPERAGLDPLTHSALAQGVGAEARALPQAARAEALLVAQRNGGWYDPPPTIGRFGTDYAYRARIAVLGLGANTVEEATYPAGLTDSLGIPLVGLNAYRITFAPDRLPPVRYFWSLTMYDSDGYLVPNAARRFSVGPSHPPLVRRADGSVVIVVSATRPSATDVNWLPAPRSQFRLNLRLYGPKPSALDGGWSPPPIENLGPLAS